MKTPGELIDGEIDSFNSQGIAKIKHMGGGALRALIRPLASLHEAIVRKDMGERYFTSNTLLLGTILILAASVPINQYESLTPTYFKYFLERFWTQWTGIEKINFVVALAWLLLFLVRGMAQLTATMKRYENTKLWHSYSYGTCGLDKYIKPASFGLLLVPIGGLIAYLGLYGVGGLLAVSGFIVCQIRNAEEKAFHDQILDMLDGQIEQENISQAVLEKSNPRTTSGFVAPVKAYVSKHIARSFLVQSGVSTNELTCSVISNVSYALIENCNGYFGTRRLYRV